MQGPRDEILNKLQGNSKAAAADEVVKAKLGKMDKTDEDKNSRTNTK